MRPTSLSTELENRSASFLPHGEPPVVADFGDCAAEQSAALENGALMDGSARARLWFDGKDALDLLNRLCTNDVRQLAEGGALTAVLPTAKGRIIDHVVLFQSGGRLGLLGGDGLGERLRAWFEKYVIMEECTVTDAAATVGCLHVFGPRIPQVLGDVLGSRPGSDSDGLAAATGSFEGAEVHVVGSPAPAAPGFDLLVEADAAGRLFAALAEAGLRPIGENAWDLLRIEAGLPRLGRELTEDYNPLEAGLRDAVSFSKGCYIGQEVVARLQNYHKVKRALCGLRFPSEVDPAALKDIYVNHFRVGQVTSATRSTRLGATVALAYLRSEYKDPGTEVESVIDGTTTLGQVMELPFPSS